MKNIILIAPPAAGKGTQAKLIEKNYNIPHISTGDLLRNALKNNNCLSKKIQLSIDNGLFVSDDIVLNLIIDRIELSDCENGYILDGFPRNLNQAKLYNNYLKKNNKALGIVILINLDKEIAKCRINNRISCSKCGRVYNLNEDKLKPSIEGKCDYCGSNLIKRKDDNNETYEIRYKEYVLDTEPIINYYREKKVLHIVDGNNSAESIYSEVSKIINELL